ncbi:MAG: zf-HC2 domain-containing protein [Bacteroidota bacterium]|jgi:predicted anti-sigma-YlaC factor YlaD
MKTKPASKLLCNEVAKYVCENLDEQLNSRKCHAIKKHLQTCSNCTAYLNSLKKMITLYRSAPTSCVSNPARKKLYAVLKFERSVTRQA